MNALRLLTPVASALLVPTLLCGCDPGPAGMPDAGADAAVLDVATSDVPADVGVACSPARTYDLVLGETLVVDGDTGTTPGALDLAGCGPASMPRPPQELVAVRLPATGGGYAVTFRIVTEGTATNFDTLVQVRSACDLAPPDAFGSCFDDQGSPRSGGTFGARAGDTVYLVVTGKGAVDRGTYRMELEVAANEAPVLTRATAEVEGADLVVRATGMDADADAVGIGAQFLDGEGRVLAIDGASRVGPFLFDFAPATTAVSFENAVARVPSFSTASALRDAVTARLFLFDARTTRSASLDVPIGSRPGLGELCEAGLGCRSGYECMAGTCEAGAALAGLCTAAEMVTLPTPTDTAVRVTRTLRLEGASIAAGSCGGRGTEAVFALTIPVTSADLRIRTDLPGTTEDTVIYVRTQCLDDDTEVVCSDDISPSVPQSEVSAEMISSGTFFVFVDRFDRTTATDISVEFELKPIREIGESCDPTGTDNRCVRGTCSAGTCTLPDT